MRSSTPGEFRVRTDQILPEKWGEESGTFWLWAWPEILTWHEPVEWLLSPSNDNPFVGDTVSVSSSGTVMLVETKPSSRRSDDPFQDFIERQERLPTTRAQLETQWERYWRAELDFINTWSDRVCSGIRPERPLSGIVPYSSRRIATRRWPQIYRDVIAPRLQDGYEARVRDFLSRVSDPIDFAYVGLITEIPGHPVRFELGESPWAQSLADAVGTERVAGRAVAAHRDGEEIVFRGWPIED